jgi:hypothetical protein
MEAPPGASVDRETPAPESGERAKTFDAGDAERELGELGKQVSEDAKEVVDVTSAETKGLTKDIPARYEEPLDAAEAAKIAGNDARLIAARERMEQEVGAALAEKTEAPASDMKTLDSQLRDIDQQLEEAHKKGDGNKRQELEARRAQVDDERKKLKAEQAAAAAKPVEVAPPAPEPAAAAEAAPPTAADKLRDLEAQYKEVSKSDDSYAADKKVALEREMEALTLEHQAGQKIEAEPPAAAEAAVEPEPQPASVVLEGKLRDLEAQYKEAQAANDPDKKAALERQLEAVTKEWQDTAKAEGHVVERPREPMLDRGEPANDNAVALDEGPEVTSRDATAAETAAVLAAVAEEEAGDARKEAPAKKRARELPRAADVIEPVGLEAAAGIDDEFEKAEVEKLRKEVKEAREIEEAKKKAEGNVLDKAKRSAGGAYDFFKESGLKTFMEGAAEMVGSKPGKLESQTLEKFSAERKKFKEKMKSIAERKAGLEEKSGELEKKRKKLKEKKERGEDVSEEEAELRREEEEIENEKAALEAEAKAVEAEDRKAKLAEEAEAATQAKLRAEAGAQAVLPETGGAPSAAVAEKSAESAAAPAKEEQPVAEQLAADREAILPPEPVTEDPEKPEPPEPPAAASSPESAPPAPPAAPTETKLAA